MSDFKDDELKEIDTADKGFEVDEIFATDSEGKSSEELNNEGLNEELQNGVANEELYNGVSNEGLHNDVSNEGIHNDVANEELLNSAANKVLDSNVTNEELNNDPTIEDFKEEDTSIQKEAKEIEDTSNQKESDEKDFYDGRKYHPLMEPKKGNTKKGLFIITAVTAFALLVLCITLIVIRERDSKVDGTVVKNVSSNNADDALKTDELNSGLDNDGSSNNATNNEVTNNEAVTYPPCEVTLGEYLGISVTAQKVEVTDEEIQAELSYLVSENPVLTDVLDRIEVQSGDIATIDYVGTVDGVEFDGGSYNGYPLEIGAGNFIEGFEEQIIGHKVGENFDINVTFPDDYSADMAGKEAVFNITIQGIGFYAEAEVNDEFIAANTEYQTLEEYKKGTYENLLESAKQAADSKKESDIINTALNNASFSNITTEEVEAKKDEMISEYETYAGYYGIDLATFASYYFGMDEATFYEEMAKAAELQVKTNYFLKKVIEVEGIVLTEVEYTEGLEKYAELNGFGTKEEFESYFGKEVIEDFLLTNKAYELIINSAKVIE